MIDSFKGKYFFLSNFYLCKITIDGKIWPSAEHIFQAAKTRDLVLREKIRFLEKPSDAKREGRKLEIRKDWEGIKFDVMKRAVELKFDQNSDLKRKLILTENELLVEGNTWHDNIWGACYCNRCQNKKGQNLLGKILMELREYYNLNEK
ncbi:MAG: NADAR family protein [Candidatus Woesearchaeota archaeon]